MTAVVALRHAANGIAVVRVSQTAKNKDDDPVIDVSSLQMLYAAGATQRAPVPLTTVLQPIQDLFRPGVRVVSYYRAKHTP